MVNGRNFFDQPADDTRTYRNIQKIPTDKGNYYQTCFLLDYRYFKQIYMLIVTDLRT